MEWLHTARILQQIVVSLHTVTGIDVASEIL